MSSVLPPPKSAVLGAMALVGLAAFGKDLFGASALAPWQHPWQSCLWATLFFAARFSNLTHRGIHSYKAQEA